MVFANALGGFELGLCQWDAHCGRKEIRSEQWHSSGYTDHDPNEVEQ